MKALPVGRHFMIMTDQRSLKFLTNQRLLGEDQFRWTCKLIGFNFEIQYRLGLENKAADALSRQMMYKAISVAQASMWDTIDSEVQEDTALRKVVHYSKDVFLIKTGSFCQDLLPRFLCYWISSTIQPPGDTLGSFALIRMLQPPSIGKGC